MQTFPAKILKTREIADKIFEIKISAPANLRTVPGQFALLTIPTPAGPLPRAYSIAAADPGVLTFWVKNEAEKSRGGSVALTALPVGTELPVRAPAGHFCLGADRDFAKPGAAIPTVLPDLKNDPTPRIFVATGIGIPPIFAMIRSALRRGAAGPIRLFFGAKTRAGMAGEKEIRALAAEFPNFSPVFILSRETAPGFETGHATKFLDGSGDFLGENGEAFLCGSTAVVADVRAALEAAGVAPGRIFAESFG